jgi:hypothetical protein
MWDSSLLGGARSPSVPPPSAPACDIAKYFILNLNSSDGWWWSYRSSKIKVAKFESSATSECSNLLWSLLHLNAQSEALDCLRLCLVLSIWALMHYSSITCSNVFACFFTAHTSTYIFSVTFHSNILFQHYSFSWTKYPFKQKVPNRRLWSGESKIKGTAANPWLCRGQWTARTAVTRRRQHSLCMRRNWRRDSNSYLLHHD